MSDTHSQDDDRVAVLGTGIMGAAMAHSLLAAGVPATVWDRSPEATAPLAAAGARVAASAAEAARNARVVITMLPTAEVVESVVFDGHVAESFAADAVWAQMGTIGIEPTERIAGQLAKLRPDVLFVDAPVSGSKGRPRTASRSSWPPGRTGRGSRCAGRSPRSAAPRSGWGRPARGAA